MGSICSRCGEMCQHVREIERRMVCVDCHTALELHQLRNAVEELKNIKKDILDNLKDIEDDQS